MNAASGRFLTEKSRWTPATAVDRRLARAVVGTLVIGGYMAVGLAFRLSAEAYLLVGIPITVAFQGLVVRQPLRALWLRGTPPMTSTPRPRRSTGRPSGDSGISPWHSSPSGS